MTDFSAFIDALEGDEFSEKPAPLEEFVTSKDYLGLPPLSDYQYTMIKASTQIYKRETLHKIYGYDEGEKIFKQTCSEVILQLGKGSGKDRILYCLSKVVGLVEKLGTEIRLMKEFWTAA